VYSSRAACRRQKDALRQYFHRQAAGRKREVGAPRSSRDVAYWHQPDLLGRSGYVRCSGRTGNSRYPAKVSRLTQSRSHQRGVCPLCAPKANRDGPDCASAPNSKPSNGERSDPNNSKSPSRIRESRASRAQCGSSTSVVRLRPLVPTARYALVARRTSLRPPR
jgi:hypothetical protein